MRPVNLAEDIVPLGEFKTHASQLLRRMHQTNRPMVITQSGRPAAVVLTPEEFEELGYREFVKAKIRAGLESVERGPSVPLDEVRAHFEAKAQPRRRKMRHVVKKKK